MDICVEISHDNGMVLTTSKAVKGSLDVGEIIKMLWGQIGANHWDTKIGRDKDPTHAVLAVFLDGFNRPGVGGSGFLVD